MMLATNQSVKPSYAEITEAPAAATGDRTVNPFTGQTFGPSNWKSRAAVAAATTQNRKIGDCYTTSSSQFLTCPDVCPFKPELVRVNGEWKLKNNGCYANCGTQQWQTTRLMYGGWDKEVEDALAEEIEGIELLPGKKPIRLKVVGDFPTHHYAQEVDAACARYKERSGQEVWGYTHNWRDLDPSDFQAASVLASCETTEQVKQAQAQGWATILVLEEFEQTKKYEADGVTIIPCPYEVDRRVVARNKQGRPLYNPDGTYQTRPMKCDDCKLCWKSELLKEKGWTVGLVAHSMDKDKVIEHLREAAHTSRPGGCSGQDATWPTSQAGRQVIPLQVVL